MSGVLLAGLAAFVGLSVASPTIRRAGITYELRNADLSACESDPESWGFELGDLSFFAYDQTGNSANPHAPPIETDLLQEPLRSGEPAVAFADERQVFVTRYELSGTCAVLRVDALNPEAVAGPLVLLTLFSSLIAAAFLTAAGTFRFVLLPLMHRIDGLAAAASRVGNAGFEPQVSNNDALGHIAAVLASSHQRIL